MKTKWYVASDTVFQRKFRPIENDSVWAKDSLEDAINHARRILAREPNKLECVIVQTVKVVRRPMLEVTVENMEDMEESK